MCSLWCVAFFPKPPWPRTLFWSAKKCGRIFFFFFSKKKTRYAMLIFHFLGNYIIGWRSWCRVLKGGKPATQQPAPLWLLYMYMFIWEQNCSLFYHCLALSGNWKRSYISSKAAIKNLLYISSVPAYRDNNYIRNSFFWIWPFSGS